MPIYEYRCDSCSHEFEQFLRNGDDEPENCPECSEPEISRLISDTSFKLKGSGWYETDYARDDEPDEPATDATASDEDGESEDADSSDEE